MNAATGYDQPLQHHQNTSQFGGQKLPAIGQPIRDVGSQPTHATTQSTPDPFGMLGLVNVINQTNPDVTTLALGIDLQAMGLDMTSKENLFKTFASPWANEPLKEDQDHFDLPQCYNAIQLPPPNVSHSSYSLISNNIHVSFSIYNNFHFFLCGCSKRCLEGLP